MSNALPLMPIPAAPSSATRRPLMRGARALRFAAPSAVPGAAAVLDDGAPPAGRARSAASPRSAGSRADPAHHAGADAGRPGAHPRRRRSGPACPLLRSRAGSRSVRVPLCPAVPRRFWALARTYSTTRSAPSAPASCSPRARAKARSLVASDSAAPPSSALCSRSASPRLPRTSRRVVRVGEVAYRRGLCARRSCVGP